MFAKLGNRGETIRAPHDMIRIVMQGPRYNMYRDMLSA